jgi:hypothetical protein
MSGNNILQTLCAVSAVMCIIAFWELQSRYTTERVLLHAALSIQFAIMMFNPIHQPMLIPGSADRAAGDSLMRRIRNAPAPVAIPAHGFLTRLAGVPNSSITHTQVEQDVLVMRDSNTSEYLRQRSEMARHFATVFQDLTPYHPLEQIAGFGLAQHLSDSVVPGCKMGSATIRPSYVFARAASLPGSSLPLQ